MIVCECAYDVFVTGTASGVYDKFMSLSVLSMSAYSLSLCEVCMSVRLNECV